MVKEYNNPLAMSSCYQTTAQQLSVQQPNIQHTSVEHTPPFNNPALNNPPFNIPAFNSPQFNNLPLNDPMHHNPLLEPPAKTLTTFRGFSLYFLTVIAKFPFGMVVIRSYETLRLYCNYYLTSLLWEKREETAPRMAKSKQAGIKCLLSSAL